MPSVIEALPVEQIEMPRLRVVIRVIQSRPFGLLFCGYAGMTVLQCVTFLLEVFVG